MAIIKPCADLRNNYNEISKICHSTNEPIYITRNGTNDLVILSDEAYENLILENEITNEEKIDRLISEHFDKHYKDFEEFKEDVLKNIDEAIKEIESGKGIPMEEALKELEKEYELSC